MHTAACLGAMRGGCALEGGGAAAVLGRLRRRLHDVHTRPLQQRRQLLLKVQPRLGSCCAVAHLLACIIKAVSSMLHEQTGVHAQA